MKVEARVLDHKSTLTGENIGMSIDHGALAHIMQVLTDLYSDPEMAVIREYSTNALDAHIEAGETRPIEVTLPTALHPFFSVRDYGEGLNADDIREIYSRYGTSTKRQSNSVVGMLGLGCKSALTYTDQFTLKGVKDGVCTQVAISRDENGAGSMTIAAQYETDDPSGVTVIVPAKAHNQFEVKATEFFKYWTEGTVLVSGKAPARITGLWLTENLLLTDSVTQGQIVMGNVAYPAPTLQSGGGYRSNVVAFVDIGEVNFTPSREALMMTPRTKETITRLQKEVAEKKVAAVEREMAKHDKPWDAVAAGLKASHLTNSKLGKFKDKEVPTRFDYDGKYILTQHRPYQKGYTDLNVLSINQAIEVVFFYGFKNITFTKVMRAKLEQWASKRNIELPVGIVVSETIPMSIRAWVNPKSIYNWQDVNDEKLPVADTGGAKLKTAGFYSVTDSRSYGVQTPADEIDLTKPLYWAGRWEHWPRDVFKAKHGTDFSVVELPENRRDKFIRLFPTAIRCSVQMKKWAEEWASKLTDEQKLALTFRDSGVLGSALKNLRLDPTKIDDPDLRKAIKEVSVSISESTYQNFVRYREFLPERGKNVLVQWEDPIPTRYPMLSNVGRYGYIANKDHHVYLYINAAYAADKE